MTHSPMRFLFLLGGMVLLCAEEGTHPTLSIIRSYAHFWSQVHNVTCRYSLTIPDWDSGEALAKGWMTYASNGTAFHYASLYDYVDPGIDSYEIVQAYDGQRLMSSSGDRSILHLYYAHPVLAETLTTVWQGDLDETVLASWQEDHQAAFSFLLRHKAQEMLELPLFMPLTWMRNPGDFARAEQDVISLDSLSHRDWEQAFASLSWNSEASCWRRDVPSDRLYQGDTSSWELTLTGDSMRLLWAPNNFPTTYELQLGIRDDIPVVEQAMVRAGDGSPEDDGLIMQLESITVDSPSIEPELLVDVLTYGTVFDRVAGMHIDPLAYEGNGGAE